MHMLMHIIIAEISRPVERPQNAPDCQHDEHHGMESEALLILLDKEGIYASSDSACLADSDEPSHVIKAMKPDIFASRQMIRFSLDAAARQEIVALFTPANAARKGGATFKLGWYPSSAAVTVGGRAV